MIESGIFLILVAVLAGLLVVERLKANRLTASVASRDRALSTAQEELKRTRQNAELEAANLKASVNKQLTETRAEADAGRQRAASAAADLQAQVDQQLADARAETARIRAHFETEARSAKTESDHALAQAISRLGALEKYQGLLAEEGSVTRVLAEAITEASQVKTQAEELLNAARVASTEERSRANARAKEIQTHADALLDQATRDAARLVDHASKEAERIGGDAYVALRDKEALEQAVKAIENLIEGYGDRYVVPTRSLLDDLAADFSHTEAGRSLAAAREQTKRMVEEHLAAACDYAEDNRRQTAIRFAIDAFNGRVDAILSRVKHDNHGTLGQEIRDAFALVNHNGAAFRNARILPAYLESRLNELKWAVVAQELKLREREEQRLLKEQIREEEKARREYERAIEDTQKEEQAIQKALERARQEAEAASAEQRTVLEARIAELNERLVAAEEKNQRAISMAQQTRKGTIYVISNVGSFGEDVFKIGMTRRLEPSDRIKELSDASVPFGFDVHAMISCDDAPAMEARLHREFEEARINRVNFRKEFFKMPLDRLRDAIVGTGVEVTFTMLAEAREYRETQALAKMTPEERAKSHSA